MSAADTENEFEFYLKFAKPLVLNLNDPGDRALAAAWINKLKETDTAAPKLRVDYLKLLLFVLQRKRLVGVFSENPNQIKTLELPATNLHDAAIEILKAEESRRKLNVIKGEASAGGDQPPYTAEHSADLLEYSAAQVIPNFGVQGYYAISIETLPNWHNIEKAILPRGAAAGAGDREKSNSESSTVSISSSAASDAAAGSKRKPGDQSGDQSEEKSKDKSKDKSTSKPKDKSKVKYTDQSKEKSTPQSKTASKEHIKDTPQTGSESSKEQDHPPVNVDAGVKEPPKPNIITVQAVRPKSPRRTRSPSPPLSSKPQEDAENRKPPTWGSNLIGVTEPPVRDVAAEVFTNADRQLLESSSQSYSPQLPPGDRSLFFLESPPLYLDETPDVSSDSPYRAFPASRRSPGSSGYPSLPYKTPPTQQTSSRYSPQLAPGDRSLFFLESPPLDLDETPDVSSASPYRPCPASRRSPGSSGYPSLPYKTPPRYSPQLPPSSPYRSSSRPAAPVAVGGREYDLQELQELGLNASDLGSDLLNFDDVADLNDLEESEASLSFREDQIERRSIDDNLDAFDRLIAEYENEGLSPQAAIRSPRTSPERPPSPYRSPEREEAPPATTLKKTTKKKTIIKKKAPSKTGVVKPEGPPSRQASTSRLAIQRPPSGKAKVSTTSVKKVITKPSASDLRNKTGAPTKVKTITTRSVVSRPAIEQPPPLASSTRIAAPGTLRRPASGSKIPPPSGSKTTISKVTSISRIPAPGSSQIPAPGGLRLPPPSGSRIPAPGGSRIPTQGASRLPTSRSRIPNAESTRIAAPGRSGIPMRPGAAPPPQSPPYSPVLPLGDEDPFFMESPPYHLYDPTPPELSGSSGYPSLPYQTPPVQHPLHTSGSSGYPSLPYRTPPGRTPVSRQAAPISMYDVDQLKELGLDAADLEDIFVDFNDENVSEISVTSTVEYETPPELKIEDREMDANLDEWDRRIAELEAENAEDIALYGSPQQSPKAICGPQSPCSSSPAREKSASPAGYGQVSPGPQVQASPANIRRSPEAPARRTPSEADKANRQEPCALVNAPCSPNTQDVIDESERFTREMLAAAAKTAETSMDSFEKHEDALGANVDVAGALPPMPTTRVDPRLAQEQANRQYKELVERGPLHDEYERHKKRQQQRRPDIPLTPPIFSKYRSVMGAEGERVYNQSEFGEFDNIEWQSGARVLEGKTELSPRVDLRGSAAKRAQRKPEAEIDDEAEPDFMQQMDEEFDKSPVQERSPAAQRQNLSETQREVAEELSQRKQTTPAEAGLPLTTPQSAPSPRRPPKSIRVQGDAGEISFEIPSYESPKSDKLYWESPPQEYYMSPDAEPLSPAEAEALPAPYGLPKRVRFPPMKPVDMSHLRAKSDMERAQAKAQQQQKMLESPPPLNPREQEDIDFYIKSPRRRELVQRAARLVADVPDTFVPKHQLRDWDLPQTAQDDVGVLEEGAPDFPASPPPGSPRRIPSPAQPPRAPSPRKSPVQSPKAPSPRQSPSPKRNQSPFPSQPPPGVEYPSDLDLSGEAPPEDMLFSPPPRTPPPPPESPPESPFSLRNRLLQGGEPEYYSQEQMTIPMGGTSSRRRVMTRRSPAPVPDVYSIRELPEDFNKEHVSFVTDVDAGRALKTRKPPKRMRVAAPPREAILESPLRPANLNELDAGGRVRHLTQPIYDRYPDLAPEPPPEDLMGEAGPMVWQPASELDRSVPEGLQSPMRLPTTVPGWSTPPHLKGKSTRQPRAQASLPTRGENVAVPSGLRNIIGQEMPPEDMAYSPPPLSPGELSRHTRPKSSSKKSPPPSSSSRKSPPQPSPRAAPSEQEEKADWPPPCQTSLARSKTSPKRQPTPLRPIALQDVTSPIDLDDEAFPDDLYHSPPPRTPPPSPESPPESPFSLRNRLFQAGEPEYYSKEQMTIPMGGTSSRRRIMTRRSPAPVPNVYSIRELPADFDQEHMPFVTNVDAGRGLKTRKPPKRMRVAAPPQEAILESPLRPTNLNEADPASRVRHLTQPIYDRYSDVAPEPLPEDLMGEARPMVWQPPSALDTAVPKGLQSPMRLPTTVPGWSTPPHLKGQSTRQPRPRVTLPTRGENVAVPPGLRDIIKQEMPPEDMAYSPPALSPGEYSRYARPPPSPRKSPPQPSPRANLFEQEENVDLGAESPPPCMPKSPTRSPKRQQSPVRPISLQDVTSPGNLDDEAFPDDLYQSPPPRTPPSAPASPQESPFSLRNRLFQAGEPEYYSKEQMTIPMGGTSSRKRVMTRRSPAPAPDVYSIRELPADFNQEHVPFISNVDASRALKTRKPPKRMRVAAPSQEAILESPMRPPNLNEADPRSRVRHLTQPIYDRYPDLAPEPLPEDLMGTAGYAQPQRSPTVLDRSLPDNLPPPIKPPAVVPGWTTPPHLKKAAKPRTPHEFKLIPPLRDVLFHEEPPAGWGYSPEGSPPISPQRRSPAQQPAKPRSRTPPQQYMGPITKPSPYLSPRSPGTPPWQAGAVFDEEPQYLVLEMPPEDFMPAGSPVERRSPRYAQPASPNDTVDSFEAHEKSFAQSPLSNLPFASPVRPPVSPRQQLRSMRSMVHDQYGQLSETSPRRAPAADFEAMERLMTVDSPKQRSPCRIQNAPQIPINVIDRQLGDLNETDKPWLKRIEHTVADIPDPHLPRRRPLVASPTGWQSPEYSPILRAPRNDFQQIEEEAEPEGVLAYSSPKSPPPSPPQRQVMQPRNLFDESFDEEDDYLDQAVLPAFRSPTSPPTPPRMEDHYNAPHTPPQSPGSPDRLGQDVQGHQYTPHHYDKGRKLLSSTLQIKNRRVPSRHRPSKRPGVSPIREARWEGARQDVPQGEFVEVDSDSSEEITEIEEVIEEYPEEGPPLLDRPIPRRGLPSGMADPGMHLISPPRAPRSTAQSRSTYQSSPPRRDELTYQSPPQFYSPPERDIFEETGEVDMFEETPPYLPEEDYMGYSPPGGYGYGQACPQSRLSPNKSPTGCPGFARSVREHQYTNDLPWRDNIQASNVVKSGSRRAPQRSARPQLAEVPEASPERYDLPMANYYGSPGRIFVRTPTQGEPPEDEAETIIEESITVIEEEPIPSDLEDSFMEENMSGFRWMG